MLFKKIGFFFLTLCCVSATPISSSRTQNNSEEGIWSIPNYKVWDMCPSKVGGDCEFAGNGPAVECKVYLKIRNKTSLNDRRELWLYIEFDAIETKHDWTHTRKTWKFKLHEVKDPKMGIERIMTDTRTEIHYTDTDHSYDVFSFPSSELVRKATIRGDTGGHDICNCTEDDTHISEISLNEIKIEVRKM